MNQNDICELFSNRFSEDVYGLTENGADEFYISVNPETILPMCLYLNQEQELTLVDLFAVDKTGMTGGFALYYTFADRIAGHLITLITKLAKGHEEFISIAAQIHAAAGYEREIHDLFGLTPIGHPNPKRLVFHSNWPQGEYPLRKTFDPHKRPPIAHENIAFDKIEGEGVYEIPVGPVHAGVIEPGHFRFSVAGEPIINLEAQLYFVHKGIEKLFEGQSIERGLFIAERISGDETFANSLAYCLAVEKMAGITVPLRAQYERLIFAELERLTSHLGDLAGICLDVAYGFASYQFKMMRGWAYLVADLLCGMRFLRSVNRPGGLRKDFLLSKADELVTRLKTIRKELSDTSGIIHANTMFVDRIEHTGVLQNHIAVDLNAVGPAGRASGIRYDVRKSFPYNVYNAFDFPVPEHNNGDVNCRMNVKLAECFASIDLMLAAVDALPEGDIYTPIGTIEPGKFAFGLVESPRGENLHWLMSGENNTIFRYKIRTPSFCNWPALCHAVKGNIVPDFPLINKSFNLSYAGNDL